METLDFQKPIFRDFAHSQVRAKSDKAPYGGGAGCGNTTGYLDSWGTMILPGGFKDTIASLLKKGFLCDGHGHATNGYTEESDLGLFTNVSEDEEGLQVEWAYHPKQKAQDARTTLEHRLSHEKDSGLSIGFFVGDGRNQPVGWEYNPDEEQPEGIDYICVSAVHIKEVIIAVSKPEFLADNLERAIAIAERPWGNNIYLFTRVYVFEVSQTLVPANEVSLIAEVRNTTKPKNKMALIRGKGKDKPEPEEDDEPNQDDTMQSLQRTVRALKNEHREHDKYMREQLTLAEGHLSKLSGKKSDEDDDEGEEPEEKPEKKKVKKEEPEEKSRAKKFFEGAK